MTFKPIKNQKTYEKIIGQVRNLVAEGGLIPGDRLMSEREMADRLEVSRSTVREAFCALEVMGIIEVRRGVGAFVSGACSKILTEVPAMQRNGYTIVIRDLEISLDTRQVIRNSKSISLSKREFDLLAYLAENAGLVLSRETLLTHVWGYKYYGNDNVVDVYIRYLRVKVDEPFSERLLHTVRGVGFTLRGG